MKKITNYKQQDQNPMLVSDHEAAYLLGVSRTMIWAYINAGMLRPVKLLHPSGIGRINRTLIDVRDLQALIDKSKDQEPNTDAKNILGFTNKEPKESA